MIDPRFSSARKPRIWPLAPLARAVGIPEGDRNETHQLTLRLSVDRTTVKRYRRLQLTTDQAETWAHRAGLHPAEVWPAWRDLYRLTGTALANAAREVCRRCGSRLHLTAEGRRRCLTCRRAQVREAVRNLRNRRSQQWITSMESAQEAS